MTEQQIKDDLMELLEDSVSYFCDEYGINAEEAWQIAGAYSLYKLDKISRLVESLNEHS